MNAALRTEVGISLAIGACLTIPLLFACLVARNPHGASPISVCKVALFIGWPFLLVERFLDHLLASIATVLGLIIQSL
jgi:hypothetical protein